MYRSLFAVGKLSATSKKLRLVLRPVALNFRQRLLPYSEQIQAPLLCILQFYLQPGNQSIALLEFAEGRIVGSHAISYVFRGWVHRKSSM